jgi:hypothetical protein
MGGKGSGGKRKGSGAKKKHTTKQTVCNRAGEVTGFFDRNSYRPRERPQFVEDANRDRQDAADEAAASAERRRVTEETAARRQGRVAQELEQNVERERGRKPQLGLFVCRKPCNKKSMAPEVQPLL